MVFYKLPDNILYSIALIAAVVPRRPCYMTRLFVDREKDRRRPPISRHVDTLASDVRQLESQLIAGVR